MENEKNAKSDFTMVVTVTERIVRRTVQVVVMKQVAKRKAEIA